MKKDDVQKTLISRTIKAYETMKLFEGDKNPQVVAMYNQAYGAYNELDNLHFELFHTYVKL